MNRWPVRMRRAARGLGVVLGFGFAAAGSAISASAREPSTAPRLRPGAIELGLAGSLTTVEGQARVATELRGGNFLACRSHLFEPELGIGYAHVADLDRLEIQLAFHWQPQLNRSPIQPYVGLGGGWRQEWLGSFRAARYPLGFQAGLRILATESAGMRLEYRWRHLFQDPVEDFSEHQVLWGLSLYWCNASKP